MIIDGWSIFIISVFVMMLMAFIVDSLVALKDKWRVTPPKYPIMQTWEIVRVLWGLLILLFVLICLIIPVIL